MTRSDPQLIDLLILVRGAGEMATGVAHTLWQSHFRVWMTEIPQPLAVRREVSFCEAIYEGEKQVKGVVAKYIKAADEIKQIWKEGMIPLLIDPQAKSREILRPHVLVDAIVAKRNLGTNITDAPLVIGLGPGFTAGRDVHVVVETQRGHDLARLIFEGEAEPNTGIPGEISGYSEERVLRAPVEGIFSANKRIGEQVKEGDVVATVRGLPVKARVSGVLRGILRDGTRVNERMKAGDIDPRGKKAYCYSISDKARSVASGVLKTILMRFNV
ncbi:MAG: EF2563 family selenium-dependent molybdenum hydroxylase system protein [Syntrophobacterales bacterium]|nr:MAG: EF2563 family selenium-dependent molybdenum hydroxylase system protein [Syntrophobacterales bacterium]